MAGGGEGLLGRIGAGGVAGRGFLGLAKALGGDALGELGAEGGGLFAEGLELELELGEGLAQALGQLALALQLGLEVFGDGGHHVAVGDDFAFVDGEVRDARL